MFVDLFMFVFLVLFVFYILVGVVLVKIFVEVDKIFCLLMFGVGVSLVGLSVIVWMYLMLDLEVKFQLIVEVFV